MDVLGNVGTCDELRPCSEPSVDNAFMKVLTFSISEDSNDKERVTNILNYKSYLSKPYTLAIQLPTLMVGMN